MAIKSEESLSSQAPCKKSNELQNGVVLEVCNTELSEAITSVEQKVEVTAQVVGSLNVKKTKKRKFPSINEDDDQKSPSNIIHDTTTTKPSVSRHKEDFLKKLNPPHCYLCPLSSKCSLIPRYRVKRHFNQCHLNHSVEFPNAVVLLCKLDCNAMHRGHYHCPIIGCVSTFHKKKSLVAHYEKHSNELKQSNEESIESMQKRHKLSIPPPKKM